MNTARVDFCMTLMNDFYYVFGGYDYRKWTLASCERYSLKKIDGILLKTWSHKDD